MIKSHSSTTLVESPHKHLAHITTWGESPKYLQVTSHEHPDPHSEEIKIRVDGAALHKLVFLRGSGKHYSAKHLPHTPGVDGVGTTPDGQQVYFFNFEEGKGSFAEYVNIAKENIFTLPPGTDKYQIAALVNPAMSSWMALKRRTVELPHNFSVLIMGATSLSGTLAISMARALGAGHVIGCARDEKKMADLDLDEAIHLCDDVADTDFSSLEHVDIILDYLYGPPAARLLTTLKSSKTIQFIQIGDLAGPQLVLHSKAIRSKKLIMTGSGVGSWSMEELREELPDLLAALASSEPQRLQVVPLRYIEEAWTDHNPGRMVFVP